MFICYFLQNEAQISSFFLQKCLNFATGLLCLKVKSFKMFSDGSVGFGGKFGVQTDHVDKVYTYESDLFYY